MANVLKYHSATLESLRWRAANVTPNDSADLAQDAAVITCLVAGNIAIVASGTGSVTLFCEAGGILPVFVDRVLSTGTTATGIVALYDN